MNVPFPPSIAPTAAVRGRLTAFVDRHLTAWEAVMALLAVVYLAAGVMADGGRPEVVVLMVLGAVFIVEFAARCFDAPDRRRYLRGHWLDLVSCLPLVGGLRGLRILRILRLAASGRLLRLGGQYMDARADRGPTLGILAPVIAVLWLGAAVAYWSFEHGVNPAVRTFGDALYWAWITATTVGYGDITPVTAEGRALAGVVIFIGIGLVGLASAQLTRRLLRHSDDDRSVLLSHIAGLETEIREMKEILLTVHADGTDRREG